MINPLRHLLAAPSAVYTADRPVVRTDSGMVTWTQFCMRVSAWEQVLGKVDGELVALYQRDSLEFMAALAALWRLGKRALIPSNNLPDNCAQLSVLTSHFAGDFPVAGVLVAGQAHSDSLAPIISLATRADALVLFTSGSSGNPVPIAKTFLQLETELIALEEAWGELLGNARIISSVSHHHIYGLLFRLLWPLCAGRVFDNRERDYWEELLADAATAEPLALVSSPAHLSRIPPVEWPLSAQVRAVFCSGAPLTTTHALAASHFLRQVVTEVYGSTETGGVAWREQGTSQAWACLPGVSVRPDETDSLLQVCSSHLPDNNWFTTADRAALDDDGRFHLCGRADRVAKVGGKRISLSAIERALEQQDGVAEARVIHLPERGDRLGAVIVLDNKGNKQLVDQGKPSVNQQLKASLENLVDRVAIPRYWRYLAALPRNRQGKTTLADLQLLFGDEPLPRLPEVISREQEGDVLLLGLFIPVNLYYFAGHFPGRPILPGVVQTHWAAHYGQELWGELSDFDSLEAIKFQQVVTANQTLQLRLEYQVDKHKLYFTYTSNRGETLVAHASGRIHFIRGRR